MEKMIACNCELRKEVDRKHLCFFFCGDMLVSLIQVLGSRVNVCSIFYLREQTLPDQRSMGETAVRSQGFLQCFAAPAKFVLYVAKRRFGRVARTSVLVCECFVL